MLTNRPSLRPLPVALALSTVLATLAPCLAAEPLRRQPDLASAAGSGAARRLDLSIGRSVVIDLPRDAKEVFVANPGVANAVVRSTRKIFLIGIANGATSVFVMDSEGQQITAFEVNVGRDLNVLRQTFRQAMPGARIDVKPAGDSILLTGTVSSAGDAQQAVDIAKAFVGQSASSNVAGTVINSLTVVGRDQVMLKVTVVEMARSALKQLGVNVGGNWNVLNTAGKFYNPANTILGVGTGVVGALNSTSGASVEGGFNVGNNAIAGGTLTALERAGVSRTLAEPTLVAISGETANFTAGGELPVPSALVCSATSSGASTGCVPSFTYKNYGVSLAFTPVVLSEGRISLRVGTEVTEIDPDNGQALSTGITAPAFRVRKTATSVEVPSGATLMTAGLISSQSIQSIRGVPGLVNLPVLGALFRSRDFQRRDTELMIMVTPYIAKPAEASQLRRPDDGFVEANDGQTVLLGRLNKIYGATAPAGATRPTGRYGFITD